MNLNKNATLLLNVLLDASFALSDDVDVGLHWIQENNYTFIRKENTLQAGCV